MRFGAVATMTVFAAVGFAGFAPACNPIDTRPNTTSSSGGATDPPTSSGGIASGGATTSSGGVTGEGGSSAKGGSGGASTNGGSGGSGSGGTTGSGGSAAGGSSVNGGAGGATAKGGSGGTGGQAAAGGTTVKGGAGGATGSGGTTTPTSVSTCTDTPPPEQTPTCAEWAAWGTCTADWFTTYCNRSCGRCSGSSQGGAGGAGGTTARGGAGGAGGSGGVVGSGGTTARGGSGGGVSGPGTTNPQISGTNGWASRYWDCCKPSCGWTGNSNPPVPSCGKDGTTRIGVDAKNGCEGGGTAYECYDFSPWYDSATNMAYGFAAKNGVTCGACFMLQFTGEGHSGANAGAGALKGQQMVVQAINIGGIESNQFDLLIPGGGVGAMTAGCTAQWGSSVELGATYGGLLTTCKGDLACMKGKCQTSFGNIPLLKAGCDWFTGWFSAADNPNLVYKQVSCPSQLTSKTNLSK